LRSSLHGLAPLLGELFLKLLLISGRCLADLLELSLKVDNPLFLRRRIPQQVSPTLGPFRQLLPQHDKIVSNTSITYNQTTTTRRKMPTVSALLMVTMLVRKSCMSSLSSNQSSCQGV
jgi:hypothetical protein